MPIIKPLSKNVYEKIKAGEVIEDPSCLIRELIDNSVDSLATKITVNITSGGLENITITDNGSGMGAEDLSICFLEHTTSKIIKIEDMFTLKTLGFRGEALSSIANISKMHIASCNNSENLGNIIHVQGNEIVHKEPLAMKKGTTITVKHLFYNTPVRKKFLKSVTQEKSKIKKEIISKSLAYPHIEFHYISDKKTILNLFSESYQDRIKNLLKIQKPLKTYSHQGNSFSLDFFLSDLSEIFDSSGNLYFFVNQKPFASKNFYGAMNRFLANLIPKGKYLAGCIYISLDPKDIDPNIHPSKKEIKILIERDILSHLSRAIANVFSSSASIYQKKIDTNSHPLTSSSDSHFTHIHKPTFSTSETSSLFSQNSSPLNLPFSNDYKYLGTCFKTYWLVEKENNLLLIDFHAAHERMRFENLKKLWDNKDLIESQPLLEAVILKLDTSSILFVEENLEYLYKSGFSVKIMDSCVLAIDAIPSFYKNHSWENDFKDFLIEYQNHPSFSLSFFKNHFLKREACRRSFMSGDYVSSLEIQKLLTAIFNNEFAHTCPHGRPFILNFSRYYLETQFLRK